MDKDLPKFLALETISKNFVFFYTRLFKTYQTLEKSYKLILTKALSFWWGQPVVDPKLTLQFFLSPRLTPLDPGLRIFSWVNRG